MSRRKRIRSSRRPSVGQKWICSLLRVPYCNASNFLLARSEWRRQRKSSFRFGDAHPAGAGRGKGSRRNSLLIPCKFPGRSTETSVYAGFMTSIFSSGKNSLINSLGREFTSHETWRAQLRRRKMAGTTSPGHLGSKESIVQLLEEALRVS